MSVDAVVRRMKNSLNKSQRFSYQQWRLERNKIVMDSYIRNASPMHFILTVLENPEYTAIALTLCAGLASLMHWLSYAVYLVTRWVALFYVQDTSKTDALCETGLILTIRKLMTFDDSLLASLAAGVCITVVIALFFKIADRSVCRTMEGKKRSLASIAALLTCLFLTPLYECDWWLDINNFSNPLMAIINIMMFVLDIICNIHASYAIIVAIHTIALQTIIIENKYNRPSPITANHARELPSVKESAYFSLAAIFSVIVFASSIVIRKQTSILDSAVRIIHTEPAEIIMSMIVFYSMCTTLLLAYRVVYRPELLALRMTTQEWLISDIQKFLIAVSILVAMLFPVIPCILIDLSILSGI